MLTSKAPTIVSLGEHIWDRLQAAPDTTFACHVALNGIETNVTAEALISAAMAVRLAIEALDLPVHALVGVVHKPGPWLHAGWLGTIWAGLTPTMIAPPSPRMEPIKYAEGFVSIAHGLGVDALVSDGKTIALLGDLLPDMPRIITDSLVPVAERTPPVPRDSEDEVVVQHTSGTTGIQKAISFTSAQIFAHAESYEKILAISNDDRIATWLPLYHDMGFIACFVMPLVLGIPIIEISPFDWVARPGLLLEAIGRHRASLCWMPNFAFRVMSSERVVAGLNPGLRLDGVKAFISCSEPVEAEALAMFAAALAPFGVRREQLLASYAMAENLFLVSQNPLGCPVEASFDRSLLESAGKAVPMVGGVILVSNGPPTLGSAVEIRRDEQVLGEGEVGAIWIAGEHLFGGYRKLDYHEVLRDGWYESGDLGFLWRGEIYIIGRTKDLIIIRGRNYYPQDIEKLASEVNGVQSGRVAAFGIHDAKSGTEKLILMIELEIGRDCDKPAILLAIRQTVAQNLDTTIGDIVVLPPRGLVKSTAGKVARAENRRRYFELKQASR